jgi:hypothetical protein
MITVIANGHLPERGLRWLLIPIMGAIVGAACGALIGAVCSGPSPVRIGDVMALAIRRPSEALRQLLDPEDLVKLGSAVRQRTTQMFQGVFEPAQKPPAEKPDTKQVEPPRE